jgi:hypothetical protein
VTVGLRLELAVGCGVGDAVAVKERLPDRPKEGL